MLCMGPESLRAFFEESVSIAKQLDCDVIDRMVQRLVRVREDGGRLFLLGIGGSAAHCSHSVNDFGKIAGIDASTALDNVSELTARINDDGWESCFSSWLEISRAGRGDVLMVLSVGGGSRQPSISANLVAAIDEAKRREMDVLGIVGGDGGYTNLHGDIVVIIPTVNADHITPHTDAFQSVVWHAIVSDPRLMIKPNKWESAR